MILREGKGNEDETEREGVNRDFGEEEDHGKGRR